MGEDSFPHRTRPKNLAGATSRLVNRTQLRRRYETEVILLHPDAAGAPVHQAPSGIGGVFLWPANEEWPAASDGVPLFGGLQIAAEDFPELPYPKETDLLQVFWDPRFEAAWTRGESSRGSGLEWFWRSRKEPALNWTQVRSPQWSADLILQPSQRFRIERRREQPGSQLLDCLHLYGNPSEVELYWSNREDDDDPAEPAFEMKLLGYLAVATSRRDELLCSVCGAARRLLFSSGYRAITGEECSFPEGMINVFFCPRCEDRSLLAFGVWD
jgi:hypothetical protein